MTEGELLKKIGQRIKDIRTEKGMPQMALAAELNYDNSNMSRLESGRVNPSISTLYKVSQALGVSLDELVKVE